SRRRGGRDFAIWPILRTNGKRIGSRSSRHRLHGYKRVALSIDSSYTLGLSRAGGAFRLGRVCFLRFSEDPQTRHVRPNGNGLPLYICHRLLPLLSRDLLPVGSGDAFRGGGIRLLCHRLFRTDTPKTRSTVRSSGHDTFPVHPWKGERGLGQREILSAALAPHLVRLDVKSNPLAFG